MNCPGWQQILFSPAAWEVAKLLIQFVGAIAIAWLAVRWALGRYKSEKLWERETAAMLDVLAAIGELEAVNSRWISEEIEQEHSNDAQDKQLFLRYNEAKAKLENVAAVASILLPEGMIATIEALLKSLNTHYSDWHEDLFETQAAVSIARGELVGLGRSRIRGLK